MTDLNETIWADSKQYPAVTEVSRNLIEDAAKSAAGQLRERGYAHVVLEPGDMTRYEMALLKTNQASAPYRFASSMGPMYPWMGSPSQVPEYTTSHYVADRNPWTGTVFCLFLNETAMQLRSSDD